MKSRLLLNVVVGKCASVLQLFTSKNQSLLLWWDTLFVLNFCFHILNGVVRFDVKSDRFTGQGLDEDLHGTTT